MAYYYCGAVISISAMWNEPAPDEYCENKVEHEGQRCAAHQEES